MKGKPWPIEDEHKLRDLFTSGTIDPGVLASSFNGDYSEEAIHLKLFRLGLLEEVEQPAAAPTSSSPKAELPTELPSVEEALKHLAAALEDLRNGGLGRNEILRLRGVISGYKIYKELLVDYMNYRALEVELLEWRNKYEALAKKIQENTHSEDV